MISQAQVDYIFEKITKHQYLAKSKPEWDKEFISLLIELFGYNDLRRELNKIHAWCLANPTKAAKRTNYRRFVLNWMNGRERKFVLSKGADSE